MVVLLDEVTLPEIRLARYELLAFTVVPEAVTKPSHEVEVPLVKDKALIVSFWA